MSLLSLKDIGKIYVSDGTVAVGLRGVNLDFDIGEFVAVTGKSGSGKTTLLNMISGMDNYEEGELYIEGDFVKAKNTTLGADDGIGVAAALAAAFCGGFSQL